MSGPQDCFVSLRKISTIGLRMPDRDPVNNNFLAVDAYRLGPCFICPEYLFHHRISNLEYIQKCCQCSQTFFSFFSLVRHLHMEHRHLFTNRRQGYVRPRYEPFEPAVEPPASQQGPSQQEAGPSTSSSEGEPVAGPSGINSNVTRKRRVSYTSSSSDEETDQYTNEGNEDGEIVVKGEVDDEGHNGHFVDVRMSATVKTEESDDFSD